MCKKMDKIGKIIRNRMTDMEITSVEVAKLMGVNHRTVDNIIHGRSRKYSTLTKIASTLNLDIDELTNTDHSPYSEPIDLNMEYYIPAINILNERIKLKSIHLTNKQKFDHLAIEVYNFLLKNNENKKEAEAFCDGMLTYGLKHCLLTVNINATQEQIIANDDVVIEPKSTSLSSQ